MNEQDAAKLLALVMNHIEACGHSIEISYDRELRVGNLSMEWDYKFTPERGEWVASE